MNKQIIYSILQYKHSPIQQEKVNVGILFYFPDELEKLHFISGDTSRLKAIYSDIDLKYLHQIINIIRKNSEKYTKELFGLNLLTGNYQDFIHNYIIKSDDTALQFSDVNLGINTFKDKLKAIESYSQLLLPSLEKKQNVILKQDERFIIKTFHDKISKNDNKLEGKFEKDYRIKTDLIDIKFDLAWKNGSTNLIKPLSFDLQDTLSIQKKTAEYCSYLTWLNDFTHKNNLRIDFLLSKPQDTSLLSTYRKSYSLLRDSNTNTDIIPLEEIDGYILKIQQAYDLHI